MSSSNRRLYLQTLEQRQLMAADAMTAKAIASSAEAMPDYEAKLAIVSQADALDELMQLGGKQVDETASGDPDAGNPVKPNPLQERTVYRPVVRDGLELFSVASGDGDVTDPTATTPMEAIPGAQKPNVDSGTPTTDNIEDLRTDLGGRLGERQSWAMDDPPQDDNSQGDNSQDPSDDQQCQTDQCHSPDDDDDDEPTEDQKRKTVSPFGNPEDQQGHTPEEEKEDTSGVGNVEDSPFFSKPTEPADKGYEGQQVGGPLFASTPVPEGVAIEGGSAADAQDDAEEKRAGFVDPGSQLSEAERREALTWSRDADLAFELIGQRVDPLINPGGEGVDSSPITGVAPIPDNGLADPPKPSSGAGSSPTK